MNVSNVNALSLDSAHTPARIVNELLDGIFDERKGTCDVSSSQCSSLKLRSSDYSYDKRLKYWKDVLKDREILTKKIGQGVLKPPSDILYNRVSTIDERDKQTVKRIMDYAERMNPVKLQITKNFVLPEKYNKDNDQPIPELQGTLPRSEKDKNKIVEISGLPKITQLELIGKHKHQDCHKPKGWLGSKVLEKRIKEKREDIERVIEFYPDIENLQIIGESLLKTQVPKHNSEIQLMQPENVCEISSESQELEKVCQIDFPPQSEPEPPEYALKINDHLLVSTSKKYTKDIVIKAQFTSQPFGRAVEKKLLTLQNIGQRALNMQWCHRAYYKNNSTLLKSLDNEFVFDNHPFRLCRQEIREISVLYHPRKVGIVKSKWLLKEDPGFFGRKQDGIVLRLVGTCTPPPEYKRKLNELQNDVLDKSNMQMVSKLMAYMGTTTPQLETVEVICPYKRTLNDEELFELLNPGYKCDRYHDLELLKDLYRKIKKPREKSWDFKVDSLKCMVLSLPDAEARALVFNELFTLLDPMKGQSLKLEQRILENTEKCRSRLLYVRGILCTSIDEWEQLILCLEKAFLMKPMRIHKPNATSDDAIALLNDQDAKPSLTLEAKEGNLTDFRDSLYMHTYTLLRNFTENIVNIIESTEMI